VVGDHVRRWAERTGVAADLTGGDVEGGDPAARYELLAILKEALVNVERHADARRVRVELAEGRGEVSVVVTDDGAGFATDDLDGLAEAGHFGLVGMRERAQRCGGDLLVASTPGEGTRVEARVPAGPSGRTVAFRDLLHTEGAR
jgi:signal transduction histidine kinase